MRLGLFESISIRFAVKCIKLTLRISRQFEYKPLLDKLVSQDVGIGVGFNQWHEN